MQPLSACARLLWMPVICNGPHTLPHTRFTLQDWGWGVVVSVMRRPPRQGAAAAAADAAPAASDPASWYIVDVLLPTAPGSVEGGSPRPAALGDDKAEPVVLPVALPLAAEVSSLRIALPDDLRPLEKRCAAACLTDWFAACLSLGMSQPFAFTNWKPVCSTH